MRIWGCRSADDFLDVGAFDTGYVCVHVLVHCLEFVCILFQLHEFFLEGVQVVHCVGEGVDHGTGGTAHLSYLVLQLLHLLHLLAHLLPLLFSLLLKFFPPLHLPLPLLFLLLFFLHLQNPVIHLDE